MLKEAGTDPVGLSASEKTILIRHIHHHRKISVSSLTARLRIARSLYYCHLKVMDKPDKDVALVRLIREAFTASHSRYGSRALPLTVSPRAVLLPTVMGGLPDTTPTPAKPAAETRVGIVLPTS